MGGANNHLQAPTRPQPSSPRTSSISLKTPRPGTNSAPRSVRPSPLSRTSSSAQPSNHVAILKPSSRSLCESRQVYLATSHAKYYPAASPLTASISQPASKSRSQPTPCITTRNTSPTRTNTFPTAGLFPAIIPRTRSKTATAPSPLSPRARACALAASWLISSSGSRWHARCSSTT